MSVRRRFQWPRAPKAIKRLRLRWKLWRAQYLLEASVEAMGAYDRLQRGVSRAQLRNLVDHRIQSDRVQELTDELARA